MKAIVYTQHGGPEVLQYKDDVPPPSFDPRTADASSVLVRVRATALNHLDLWIRRGIKNQPIPFPHIPSSDVAGEVSAIGLPCQNTCPEVGCASPESMRNTVDFPQPEGPSTAVMQPSSSVRSIGAMICTLFPSGCT